MSASNLKAFESAIKLKLKGAIGIKKNVKKVAKKKTAKKAVKKVSKKINN